MHSPDRWKLLFTRVPFFAILAFFAVCELRFSARTAKAANAKVGRADIQPCVISSISFLFQAGVMRINEFEDLANFGDGRTTQVRQHRSAFCFSNKLRLENRSKPVGP